MRASWSRASSPVIVLIAHKSRRASGEAHSYARFGRRVTPPLSVSRRMAGANKSLMSRGVKLDRTFPALSALALSPVFGLGVGLLMLNLEEGVGAGTLAAVSALAVLVGRLNARSATPPASASEIALQRRLRPRGGHLRRQEVPHVVPLHTGASKGPHVEITSCSTTVLRLQDG